MTGSTVARKFAFHVSRLECLDFRSKALDCIFVPFLHICNYTVQKQTQKITIRCTVHRDTVFDLFYSFLLISKCRHHCFDCQDTCSMDEPMHRTQVHEQSQHLKSTHFANPTWFYLTGISWYFKSPCRVAIWDSRLFVTNARWTQLPTSMRAVFWPCACVQELAHQRCIPMCFVWASCWPAMYQKNSCATASQQLLLQKSSSDGLGYSTPRPKS